LGDGGSYFCGFALAWSTVLLVERNQSVSPVSGLLICIYPFTEVIFSIYRRKMRARNAATGPDAQHLHSLIYRRFTPKNIKNNYANSLAGLTVGMLSLPPAFCAFFFHKNDILCLIAVLFFIIAYIIFYRRVINFKWF
jgi:UDP-N-acetylmuramyl pentapeptide phosphotransferase/UDP-N-acetylglucosamine-1-phosphate transferase